METELRKVLLNKINHIVSDGDWDGIVATALLIIYARKNDIEPVIQYPHPRELKNSAFENVVSVEITPTKTKICNSVIFDHHEKVEGHGNVWVFDSNAPSVASLVSEFLDIEFDKNFMDAINAIDQGDWRKTELSQILFKAFQIDPASFPRMEITYRLANYEIDYVISWATERARLFNGIMKIAEKLKENKILLWSKPAIVYFTYRVGKDEGARRLALLDLEEEYDIAISLGIQDRDIFVTGTIATKKDIDLSPLFKELRKMGYNAGGRKNVGGFQAVRELKISKVLDDLKLVVKKVFSEKSFSAELRPEKNAQ